MFHWMVMTSDKVCLVCGLIAWASFGYGIRESRTDFWLELGFYLGMPSVVAGRRAIGKCVTVFGCSPSS